MGSIYDMVLQQRLDGFFVRRHIWVDRGEGRNRFIVWNKNLRGSVHWFTRFMRVWHTTEGPIVQDVDQILKLLQEPDEGINASLLLQNSENILICSKTANDKGEDGESCPTEQHCVCSRSIDRSSNMAVL